MEDTDNARPSKDAPCNNISELWFQIETEKVPSRIAHLHFQASRQAFSDAEYGVARHHCALLDGRERVDLNSGRLLKKCRNRSSVSGVTAEREGEYGAQQ
jgi:hypothetical protein